MTDRGRGDPGGRAAPGNEQFAYWTTGFLTNPSFEEKWGDAAEAIVDKAKGRVGDEIGSDRGVYKDMEVGKV